MSSDSLAAYYARRAQEYERVYAKPERQQDLRWLAGRLGALLGGRDVLEVACGTGYWTQVLVRHAGSVVACDLNDEVLQIAAAKPWGAARVRFCRHDAFDVAGVPRRFDAGFAGFWWSHVPRGRLAGFLDQWHRRIGPGGLLVAIDNRYVSGSSTPIGRTDAGGNTYQLRRRGDGSRHEVLKNFPDAHQLLADLARLQPPVVDARGRADPVLLVLELPAGRPGHLSGGGRSAGIVAGRRVRVGCGGGRFCCRLSSVPAAAVSACPAAVAGVRSAGACGLPESGRPRQVSARPGSRYQPAASTWPA
jgi:SAM-dependent methyltransferase